METLEIVYGLVTAIATIIVITKMNRYVVKSETKTIVDRLGKHDGILSKHTDTLNRVVPIIDGYVSDKAFRIEIETEAEESLEYIPEYFSKAGRKYIEFLASLILKFSASIPVDSIDDISDDKVTLRVNVLVNKLIEASEVCFGKKLTFKMFNKYDYLFRRYNKELLSIKNDNVNSKSRQFKIETIRFMQRLSKSFVKYLIAWDNRRDK